MKKFFYTSILTFIFSATTFAEAPPIVLGNKDFYELGLNLDILEDPSGKLTIDDVSSSKWEGKFKRSTQKKPNFGFSASSFWARFKFQTKGQQKDWVLSQHYYLQDEILFYKKSKGSWQE